MDTEYIKQKAIDEQLSYEDILSLVEDEIGVLDDDDSLYCEDIANDIYNEVSSYYEDNNEEEATEDVTQTITLYEGLMELQKINNALIHQDVIKANREKRIKEKKILTRNINVDKKACKVKVDKKKRK